jgi:nucleoside-diphosphate-sugar epimerase
MRVLVLGGTGFIGRPTVETLRAEGYDVLVASRSEHADLRIDAEDSATLTDALDRPYEVVVNLLGAGLTRGTSDHNAMHRINGTIPGTILALLAKQPMPAHLVHAASSTERRKPHHRHESDYSESKHEGAIALRAAAEDSGVPLTMLTIHNTYGPHQPIGRFVAATIGRLAAGETVRLDHPARVRDFVFLDDVVKSIGRAVSRRPDGREEADIGTGTGITLEDAAIRIARALGRPEQLVQSAEVVDGDDPNPTTVAAIRYGTYGLCRTDFDSGLALTLAEAQCGG